MTEEQVLELLMAQFRSRHPSTKTNDAEREYAGILSDIIAVGVGFVDLR